MELRVLQVLSQVASTRTTSTREGRRGRTDVSTNVHVWTLMLTNTSAQHCKFITRFIYFLDYSDLYRLTLIFLTLIKRTLKI